MAATKGQIKERKNGDEADRSGNGSLTRKAYDRELARLHGELVTLQDGCRQKGLKVCIVFEGRDGAGKGGAIKAITERVSLLRLPRRGFARADRSRKVTDVHPALHPASAGRGEVVIFDRSWYNRAGVERVMGFCRGASERSWEMCRPSKRRSSSLGSSCSNTGWRSARRSRRAP